MKSIKEDVKSLIDRFLSKDIEKRNGLEAVILCGSHAIGRATSRSDIDLCYIGSFQDLKREVVYFSNNEIQLMIAPWEWYEDVIKNYERKSNIGTITTMMSYGICVFGDVERWSHLHNLSKEYYEMGPCQPEEKELRRIRMRITELWDSYLDQVPKSINQLWLSYHIIKNCVEAQFIVNSWWAVKPKYEIEELEKKDANMAKLVNECLQRESADKQLIYELCNNVLEPLGGFLREGWS